MNIYPDRDTTIPTTIGSIRQQKVRHRFTQNLTSKNNKIKNKLIFCQLGDYDYLCVAITKSQGFQAEVTRLTSESKHHSVNQLRTHKEMKKDIHPSNYREVVFKDMSNEEIFITRSTVASKETIEVDGKTYPLVKLEITSSSHPFFTGKQKLVDTAGRVDKFMSRYGNRNKK